MGDAEDIERAPSVGGQPYGRSGGAELRGPLQDQGLQAHDLERHRRRQPRDSSSHDHHLMLLFLHH